MPAKGPFHQGDPAPYFTQASFANPNYVFDTAAGRYIVLCFFGSTADTHTQAALSAVKTRLDFFNDKNACFFGLSTDPADKDQSRVANQYPGFRFFWDFDLKVSRLYGAADDDALRENGGVVLRRRWVVLDPTLRVIRDIPFRKDQSDIAALLRLIDTLPPTETFAGLVLQAPIIFLPNVFEAEFCRRLVELYDAHGGDESGFMREVGGKTVGRHDHSYKSRKDYYIENQLIINMCQAGVTRRIIPEIKKAHQFIVTRMERYIIACYSAEDKGHFNAHRDNTTRGTAHRRFAVSINLNDDFEGGDLTFPEYGSKQFRPPVGGAVVFSCSLLHAVSTVTRGKRYAFLPFLYDDAAAKIREENKVFLESKTAKA